MCIRQKIPIMKFSLAVNVGPSEIASSASFNVSSTRPMEIYAQELYSPNSWVFDASQRIGMMIDM